MLLLGFKYGLKPVPTLKNRTSAAEAVVLYLCYGTAEAVPFVNGFLLPLTTE
jgi:hypothetical protein